MNHWSQPGFIQSSVALTRSACVIHQTTLYPLTLARWTNDMPTGNLDLARYTV